MDNAIAAATNGEGLRTGGGPVTVPLDALFAFPSWSAVSTVTFAGLTFSASSTAPGWSRRRRRPTVRAWR